MAAIQIHDEQLVERLQALAQQENRSVEEIVRMWLENHTKRSSALASMDGVFDDDIADLSTSVRETMYNFYQRRDDRSS